MPHYIYSCTFSSLVLPPSAHAKDPRNFVLQSRTRIQNAPSWIQAGRSLATGLSFVFGSRYACPLSYLFVLAAHILECLLCLPDVTWPLFVWNIPALWLRFLANLQQKYLNYFGVFGCLRVSFEYLFHLRDFTCDSSSWMSFSWVYSRIINVVKGPDGIQSKVRRKNNDKMVVT